MRTYCQHFAKALLLIVVSAVLMPSTARAQQYGMFGLSCTRASLALGDAVLPGCAENKAETLDSVTYYVSAYC
jgi:hypothetical protein